MVASWFRAPPRSDYTADALKLFTTIAERRGLHFSYEMPPYVELVFTMPKQGLDFELTLTFQDVDELHINLEDVRFSYFPFAVPKRRESFERAVTGLISGTHRVEIFSRPWARSAVKGFLQTLADGDWVTEARYYIHSGHTRRCPVILLEMAPRSRRRPGRSSDMATGRNRQGEAQLQRAVPEAGAGAAGGEAEGRRCGAVEAAE